MAPFLWIIVFFVSLLIAAMCTLAAVTILGAIGIGKLTDPDAWKTAVFLVAVGCLFWFLCHEAWRSSE
jgi:hypothetical protein